MRIIKQHITTSLFLCCLFIAGICNLFTHTQNTFAATLAFSANFIILTGLIVFWGQSVRKRILPTKTRSFIIASSVVMAIYTIMRIFKYRMVVNSVIVERYISYAYFIPLLLLPSLFLITSICLSFSDIKTKILIERIIIAISIVLSVFVLTNDLHFLVYRPYVKLSEFNLVSGTYTWGPGFFMLYAWMILLLFVGLVLLLRVKDKYNIKHGLALMLPVLFWISLKLFQALVIEKISETRMYTSSDIDCFCMILFFECCIRNRLIPYNRNYEGFFRNLKVPIMITDSELHTVLTTGMAINVQKAELSKAIHEPVYSDEETRLSAMQIRAGYAFWIENEKELREQRKRLAEANALLSEENDLIDVENKLKAQKAHLEAQNKVYERITSAIFLKQKRIEAILGETVPGTEDFSTKLGKVCVLNAYSKRKTNLLLLSEDNLPKSNRELFLALAESCRFLKCLGIDAAAVGEEYSKMSLSAINDIYDTFETVIETYLPMLSRMTVSILPDGIRIAMETGKELELPDTSLPVTSKESDGLLFLTILKKPEGVKT